MKFPFLNQRQNKEQTLLFLLWALLLLCIWIVYWQVRTFDFINFDDPPYISENSFIHQGLTPDTVKWAFTTFHEFYWHPVTWLSLIMDCHFFGVRPDIHHLVNVLFHLANTLLLFLIFRKMTGCPWRSLFVAGLFALHPLHVESVAWIAERKDVLSTFFGFLALWHYIAYVRQPSKFRYGFILLFFSLGLMSKPMLVTLPYVFLLLDFWPLNRFQPFDNESSVTNMITSPTAIRIIREKIPLFLMVLFVCAITYYAQHTVGAVKSLDDFSLAQRIGNAFLSYVRYIWKMIYPKELGILYPFPTSLAWGEIILSCLFLALVSLMAWFNALKRPYLLVGWLWFLGVLVPVIGIVQVGIQAMADRHTYVPLIGLFIIMGWGIPDILKNRKFKKRFLGITATSYLILLTGLSWHQTGLWKDSTTLYTHTLAITENNYLIHYNFGSELIARDKYHQAMDQLLKAIRIKPDYAYAHHNLANLLSNLGNPEAAVRHYLKALEVDPDFGLARYNLGITYLNQGKTDEAIRQFELASKLMPDNEKLQFKMAIAYYQQGWLNEAVRHFQAALAIKPDFAEARLNLGAVLFKSGHIRGAIEAFKKAVELQPENRKARQYLQKALMQEAL